MRAAVYRGSGKVVVEDIPELSAGPGEMLIRVRACGVCPTDLKKIKDGLLPPPRVYGHETAGEICALGGGLDAWKIGEKVAVYHHVGCGVCEECRRGDDVHCASYKRVGVSAGFEPAGGGYSQVVKVSPWIVAGGGVTKIPVGIHEEAAAFLEPVNTCVKAVQRADVNKDSKVLILGAGPIGLLMLLVCRSRGARVWVSDPRPDRVTAALSFGAMPLDMKPETLDSVFVCAPSESAVQAAIGAVRPGGIILLFAHTKMKDLVSVDAGDLCRNDKVLLGSYSSSVSAHAEAADLIFSRKINPRSLITHRFSLEQTPEALGLAMEPREGCLKVMVLPNA